MSKRVAWIIIAIAISAIAYYAAAFGFGHALTSTTRFRIILAMLFGQSVGLVVLGSSVISLLGDLRSYHRASTQVAMLKGMWRSLDLAVDHGGLTPEARAAIYREAEGAFGIYDQIMRRNEF